MPLLPAIDHTMKHRNKMGIVTMTITYSNPDKNMWHSNSTSVTACEHYTDLWNSYFQLLVPTRICELGYGNGMVSGLKTGHGGQLVNTQKGKGSHRKS